LLGDPEKKKGPIKSDESKTWRRVLGTNGEGRKTLVRGRKSEGSPHIHRQSQKRIHHPIGVQKRKRKKVRPKS